MDNSFEVGDRVRIGLMESWYVIVINGDECTVQYQYTGFIRKQFNWQQLELIQKVWKG